MSSLDYEVRKMTLGLAMDLVNCSSLEKGTIEITWKDNFYFLVFAMSKEISEINIIANKCRIRQG